MTAEQVVTVRFIGHDTSQIIGSATHIQLNLQPVWITRHARFFSTGETFI